MNVILYWHTGIATASGMGIDGGLCMRWDQATVCAASIGYGKSGTWPGGTTLTSGDRL